MTSTREAGTERNVALERRRPSILARKPFQLAGALFVAVLLPWWARTSLGGPLLGTPAFNATIGNTIAVIMAFWIRVSVRTYAGNREADVILPSVSAAHGIIFAWFVFARSPYDPLLLTLGYLAHIAWLFILHVYTDVRFPMRMAVVPFGRTDLLVCVPGIEWLLLKRPQMQAAHDCNAIVVDFSADLPDEWSAFLADAALERRTVCEYKQLNESLSGRVNLEHISDNSAGSLTPSRAYLQLKAFVDFVCALVALPAVVPLIVVIAIAIRLDSRGPAFFQEPCVGFGGRMISLYKFRTTRPLVMDEERAPAMASDGDARVTRLGKMLRTLGLDGLPQIFNILKWEMSWIGPRPEARALARWYTSGLPFYSYRHVVKPGIYGWARANEGRNVQDEVHRELQYDFYYIKYVSAGLDLLVFFRAMKSMISGRISRKDELGEAARPH